MARGGRDELLLQAQRLMKGGIAARSPLVFVHAAVVGWHGRALVLPGPSRAGKSTLTQALVRAGATYYSDEYAVIDGRGLVVPFAQPIMLRASATARQRPLDRAATGGGGDAPLSIALVAFTSYVRGARWQPTSISRGEGALRMVSFAVQHASHPARVMRHLTIALQGATAMDGVRGESTDAARRLLDALDEQATRSAATRSGRRATPARRG